MTDENSFGNSMSKNWPRWRDKAFVAATALFFFLLPLQTRYIFREMPFYEYGTLSVFLVEIWGWVVIVFGGISSFCHSEEASRRLKNPIPAMHGAGSFARLRTTLIGLAAFAFLSIAWAVDKVVALQAAVRLFEGVLLYFVVSSYTIPHPAFGHPLPRGEGQLAIPLPEGEGRVRVRGKMGGIMWAFLFGAVLQAVLGIYQFLSQSSFASSWLGMAVHDPRVPGTVVVEFGDERWLRAYGGLPHPNVLGGYLVVALIVCYARLQEVTEGYKRLLLQTLIPILLTGIFFSFSRAAWLATIGVFAWWCMKTLCHSEVVRRGGRPKNLTTPLYAMGSFARLRMTKDFFYILLTMIYILLLALTFRPLVSARIFHTDTARLEVKSRVERVSGLRESWELIKNHPMRGVGIGNYTQGVAREVRPDEPLYYYQPVHNVFLLVWAELGTLGLLLFLPLLYMLWRRSSNYLLLTTFYILLLFDHYLWTLPFGILLFWAILGLSTHKTQTQT